MTSKGIKIVVLPDMHAHPDYDNKRFNLAGEFAAEQQPDVLVCVGDFADVTSLTEHNSKLERSSKRWKLDKQVTKDAMATLMRPFYRRKRKMPQRVMCLGNHEHRVNRWVGEHPEFEGDMSVDDLGYRQFGWEVFPWKQYVEIAGWHFVHEVGTKSKVSTTASSPKYGSRSQGVSIVHGHTHEYFCHPYPTRSGNMWAIDTGCWIHKDMGWQEGWSNPTEWRYWRGAWVINNAKDGDGVPRPYSAEELGD